MYPLTLTIMYHASAYIDSDKQLQAMSSQFLKHIDSNSSHQRTILGLLKLLINIGLIGFFVMVVNVMYFLIVVLCISGLLCFTCCYCCMEWKQACHTYTFYHSLDLKDE